MLSQVENGKLIPTSPTLTRIAMVFDVGLDFFSTHKMPRRRLENELSKPHAHEGYEFIHVLSGHLSIFYQKEEHVLHAGDSVYFDASEMHSYHGDSEMPARALVLTTPPRL